MQDQMKMGDGLQIQLQAVCRVCARTENLALVQTPTGEQISYCQEHLPFQPATMEELVEALEESRKQQE